MSEWPYQYTSGRRADDGKAVGADVAVHPKGLAGVEVGMGADTTEAESVPGTVQPPCEEQIWVRREARRWELSTYLAGVEVHKHRRRYSAYFHGVVSQNLARARLA
jgi:hypothetical protein